MLNAPEGIYICIAILKKAGKVISEDSLYNGWLANDDGAGFAYVNNEQRIIIHTSMNWKGFIDEYNKAVEEFGDTSDFLIHFRITSKGTTTLDNCHPFKVDEDRAIIHNGTITNIHIDKDDDRSDTKILAEDMLSKLPNDWEDNAIIRELLETYVGWSKIILLHRTKGGYIFNESKGHWFEGNWYSNDSYKTRRTFNNNSRDLTIYKGGLATDYYQGYWDAKENRWVSGTEQAENMKLLRASWTRCTKCNGLEGTEEMTVMQMSDGTEEMWCSECYDKWVEDTKGCECCDMMFLNDEVKEYFNYEEGKFISLCINCFESLTDSGISLEDLQWSEGIQKKVGEV